MNGKGQMKVAAARRTSGQVNYRNMRDYRQMYVYGNAVPQPEVLPRRVREVEPDRDITTSRQVRKNRRRAKSMDGAYAAFLTGAAVFAVFICVMFLQLQSDIVNRSENVTALQEQLAELTEQNDTAYQAAEDSLNLESVRAKAMNELGMVYAAQGSVVEYENPAEDSVTQYNNIPEDGILAQSRELSE